MRTSDAELVSGVGATWFGGVGDDRVDVEAFIRKPNACYCGPAEVDLEAKLSANFRFEVSTTGRLQVKGGYSYELETVTKHCCAITTAIIWPLVPVLSPSALDKLDLSMLNWYVGLWIPIGEFVAGIEYRMAE